jgi:hypothetical protein
MVGELYGKGGQHGFGYSLLFDFDFYFQQLAGGRIIGGGFFSVHLEFGLEGTIVFGFPFHFSIGVGGGKGLLYGGGDLVDTYGLLVAFAAQYFMITGKKTPSASSEKSNDFMLACFFLKGLRGFCRYLGGRGRRCKKRLLEHGTGDNLPFLSKIEG